MSTMLRSPWVSASICENLKDALAKREGAGIEVLDNIGPMGELQLPGNRFKPLQVVQFLSFEDPITAVLSDKSVKITCKFAPEARSKHEASNGRMTTIKGGIIKVISYQIRFLGVDGVLFWKGITYQDQIGNRPTSRKSGKGSEHGSRSGIGGSKSTAKDWGKGDTSINLKLVPTPEPVLYITDFTYIGSAGEPLFGKPTGISSRGEVNELLLGLPRKKYLGEEAAVGFKHDSRSMGSVTTASRQRKERKDTEGHRGVYLPQSNSSQKNVSSRHPQRTHGSDDEIRSQPQVDSDDVSSEELSQLPFATQAPPRFPSTFDDLEFSTQEGQKNTIASKSPPSSPLPSSFRSTGHSPQVVITTKSHEKKKEPRPHQVRKNAENRKPGINQRFINYANETEFEESTAGSIVEGGRQNKILGEASNRYKRKRSGSNDATVSGPGSLDAGGKGQAPPIHRGWQGMTRITKEDTIIPKDQQEVLDRPESWYPYKNTHHISGYDLVPKVQLVPKSHPPRDRQVLPIPAVPVATTHNPPSPTLSSDDEAFPWPSSPLRPPKKDINAMPPDSSMPSGSQPQRAGRWSMQEKRVNLVGTQGNSTSSDSSLLSQVSTQWGIGVGGSKGSPVQSSPGYSDGKEEVSEYSSTGKRITRAANGVSKRVLTYPNNVEPLRMAKANQRPKLPAARKRHWRESQPEDEFSEGYETSDDEQISELINNPDLPVDVMNPNGRTRVAVFGGILKAQQVEMWEKEKKKRREQNSGNAEDEISSDEDGMGSSNGNSVSGEQSGSAGGNDVDGNALGIALGGTMESAVLASSNANGDKPNHEPPLEVRNVDNHSCSGGTPGSGNDLVGVVGVGEHPLSAVQPTYHSEVIGPLPSKSNHSTHQEDKVPELPPDSSLELPVAEPMDIDINGGGGIPQPPLTPLNLMMRAKATVSSILKQRSLYSDRLKEIPADPITSNRGQKSQAAVTGEGSSLGLKEKSQGHQATAPGDSRSTAIFLQTSSAPEVSNLPGNQKYTSDFDSSIPLPANNTAPTVQVQETPYRKGGSKMEDTQCLSPTISKSRAGPEYFGDGFDDISLVPGTNTEELHTSCVPALSEMVRQPTPEQDSSPPEGQLVPLDHVSSSETENSEVEFPNELAMSQQQLQREFQEHMDVEVPVTSEVEETRIEDEDRSQYSPSQRPSRTKGARKVIKIVDFQSQEIRAADAHHVSSLLEEQKREFMGLKDGYDFAGLEFEGDKLSRGDGGLSGEPELQAPDGHTISKSIEIGSSPVPSVTGHLSIEFDDKKDAASDLSQSNIRKRNQSPPSEITKSVKKPRADDESYRTSNRSVSAPPPHHTTQESVRVSTRPHNESQPNPDRTGSSDEDLEPGGDDLMAGFPSIDSRADHEFKPSWPPQASSEPEMYAGIRKRHLNVPGYKRLTDEQKEELDRRRQEYFGIKTSTKRLFSVELQRSMQKASSLSSRRAAISGAAERAKPKEDEWYRDENTPVKVFYRKFKELKQVKAELAAREGRSGDGGA